MTLVTRQKMRNNEDGQEFNRNHEKKKKITNTSKQLDKRETVTGFPRLEDAMFCSICKEASAVDILLSNQPLRTLIF